MTKRKFKQITGTILMISTFIFFGYLFICGIAWNSMLLYESFMDQTEPKELFYRVQIDGAELDARLELNGSILIIDTQNPTR